MSDPIINLHLEPAAIRTMANTIEKDLDAIIDPAIPQAPSLHGDLFQTVYDVLEEFRCGSRTLRTAFDDALFKVRKGVDKAEDGDLQMSKDFDAIGGDGAGGGF
jgi:hypothetical protein